MKDIKIFVQRNNGIMNFRKFIEGNCRNFSWENDFKHLSNLLSYMYIKRITHYIHTYMSIFE